jgi:hypothetical protein
MLRNAILLMFLFWDGAVAKQTHDALALLLRVILAFFGALSGPFWTVFVCVLSPFSFSRLSRGVNNL